MKIFLGVALIVALASPVQARLGETPDQVAARFGIGGPLATIQSGPQKDLRLQNFQKQGFEIHVLFRDVSVGETYTAGSKLTEDQIQALLAANSEGHQWKESATDGTYRFWTRDDGATARLMDTQFEFKSKLLVDQEEAWRQAHLPNVGGF